MKRFLVIFMILLTLLSLTAVCVSAEVNEGADEGIAEDQVSGGIADVIAGIWEKYAGAIFSALTLITSLLLAYFFKRGLVPVVWNGLDQISRAGQAAEETATALAKSCDERIAAFCEVAAPILDAARCFTEQAGAMAEYIRALEERMAETEGERACMRTLMRGVAEMLFGVFSAANLPQYAMEQLGQKYAQLMAALSDSAEVEHAGQASTDL